MEAPVIPGVGACLQGARKRVAVSGVPEALGVAREAYRTFDSDVMSLVPELMHEAAR